MKVEEVHHLDEEARAGRPVGGCRHREAGAGARVEELHPLRLTETVPGVAAGAEGAVAAAGREGGYGRGHMACFFVDLRKPLDFSPF